MRIISGKFGGQIIDSTKGNKTHPMSEKIRGGMFASLGDVSRLAVLDLFAGTGAIGLEAVSRGASNVTFVESDKHAASVIVNNIQKLGVVDAVSVFNMPALTWLKRNSKKDKKFDLIFCDPPFDHLNYDAIEASENYLEPNGVLILSWPPKADLPRFKRLRQFKVKTYGDAQILYFRQ